MMTATVIPTTHANAAKSAALSASDWYRALMRGDEREEDRDRATRAGRESSWSRRPKPIAIPESTIDATARRPAIVSVTEDRSAGVSSTALTGGPHRGRGPTAVARPRVRSGPGRRPGRGGRVQPDGEVGVSETGTWAAGCSSRGSALIAHHTTMQR